MTKFNPSSENYLETIYMLTEKNGNVRSVDIANELNFSKPSVSIAIKKLKQQNFVAVDNHGAVTLTAEGIEIAKNMYERHTVLSAFFVSLGIAPDTAKEDACLIEHILSEETFQKVKTYWKNNLKS